jgi:hypothetical protein
MFLNILTYLWYLTFLFSIQFVIYQLFRGKLITWREIGFFIFGIMVGGIPFYWIMQQNL